MRSLVAVAILLFVPAALGSTATVNAGEDRKPIAPTIYNGVFGDEMQQAQLAASYAINLPNGELARVALLGTFGQKSISGVFSEAPLPPAQGAAIELFTNYDGKGARFGNTSIHTFSSDPLLSVFASFDLDANVTVVLLNKSPTASSVVDLGFKGIGQKGDWRAFEMTADGRITPAGTGTIYDALLTRTVQPYTALLVEFRPVAGILPVKAPPLAEISPAASIVEVPADAPAATGCSSAADVGLLSLALLGLVGFVRRRSTRV